MRILRWIGIVVIVLAVVFVAGAYLLPREVTITRSIEVNAPADQVFPHVNSMKATEGWSPWLERDPNVQLTYTGPDEGVGATLAWASDQRDVGVGTQVIVTSETDKRVETDLDFGDMGTAKAAFILDPAGEGTNVTWTLVTDMGNSPMGRWMGLMMDGLIGPDYEAGLANLKALVEG